MSDQESHAELDRLWRVAEEDRHALTPVVKVEEYQAEIARLYRTECLCQYPPRDYAKALLWEISEMDAALLLSAGPGYLWHRTLPASQVIMEALDTAKMNLIWEWLQAHVSPGRQGVAFLLPLIAQELGANLWQDEQAAALKELDLERKETQSLLARISNPRSITRQLIPEMVHRSPAPYPGRIQADLVDSLQRHKALLDEAAAGLREYALRNNVRAFHKVVLVGRTQGNKVDYETADEYWCRLWDLPVVTRKAYENALQNYL